MSSIQTTAKAQAPFPEWDVTETEAASNSPGDNAVDFILNAFEAANPANGWVFTETSAARISDIGGAQTFDRKYTYPAATMCRQAQSSWGANGWVMSISYDDTNGTLCHYSTDGWANVSQSTVSSAVNPAAGETYMPGLWMDQRVPGRAICTAYTTAGGFPSPLAGSDFCHNFDFTENDGGFSANGSTSWVSGEGWKGYSFYNQFGGYYGWERLASIYRTNDPFDPTRLWVLYDLERGSSPSGNIAKGSFILSAEGYSGEAENGSATHGSSVTDYELTVTTFPALSGDPMDKLGVYLRSADWSAGGVGSVTATIKKLQVCGTGTDPYSDHASAATAAAFVTTDYGATWTEITDSSIVGYIQPGAYPSGAIEAPYVTGGQQKLVYGYYDTAGTYPAPRLKRVVGTTVTDISPSADGKTYGVPYNRASRRAVAISVKDGKTAILCGESRDASSGVSTYRVFRTPDIFAATPLWVALSGESSSLQWRGVYPGGNSALTALFMGTTGNMGRWNYTKSAATIQNVPGDPSKAGVNVVGLCSF